MKTFRINVKGRVQGVFFRVSTREKAIGLGLKGWVRNEPDGSVLIEAEGSEKEMVEFIEWCKIGPPSSKVESISKEELGMQGYAEFSITY